MDFERLNGDIKEMRRRNRGLGLAVGVALERCFDRETDLLFHLRIELDVDLLHD